MTDHETLREQRQELADMVAATYSPSDFPGSAAWCRAKTRQDALDAFDAQHPEIVAAIRAERQQRDADAARTAGWI